MSVKPAEGRTVEAGANRRLLLGVVTAVVIMGCFWYFVFRTLRLIGAAAAAGAATPESVVEFLAVVALCVFLLGVADVLPHRWMLTTGLSFVALDFGGHLLFGTTSTLLLGRGVLQYGALVGLLAACLQARRLRVAERTTGSP